MALQPQGLMAQDQLTTTGTQDAGLILSQTEMMKVLEVPSYYSFRVNNSMLACLHGSISSLQRQTYPHTICPSGFIVKQVSLSACLVFEIRSTCQDFVAPFKEYGLPCAVDSPSCDTGATIFWSVNPNHQSTEKSGDVLHRCRKFWFQS